MTAARSHARGPFARLPARLAPREQGTPGGRRQWRRETTFLGLVGAALVVIVINASGFVSGIGNRIPADTATWRQYARNETAAVSVTTLQIPQTRDVACGDTASGPAAGTSPRLCLLIVGSTMHGVRSVIGGWRLPAGAPDVPAYRRRCFGVTVKLGLCPLGEPR